MAEENRRRCANRTRPRFANSDRAYQRTSGTLRFTPARTNAERGRINRQGERPPEKNGVCMELKKGYKQTDIGVIPTEWEVEKLESVTPKNAKFGIVDGPFGSNLKTIHYRKSGIPIITSGYVTEGRFEAIEYLYVDQEKFNQEKRSTVRPGDIVMAKIGARCGASAILPESHQTGILSGNALKITVDESRHSTFYVWQ